MAFVPKVWHNNDPSTAWSAAAAIDMETRLAAYTDTLNTSLSGIVTTLAGTVTTNAANAVNDGDVAAGILSGSYPNPNFATTTADALGVNVGATVRRGKSIIATTEARTNAAYGTLATPDQVSNVVLPTDGLIFIVYQAIWQETVSINARAAIFIGVNQLKNAVNTGPAVVQEAATGAGGSANVDVSLTTSGYGLVSLYPPTAPGSSDVTTGQSIGMGASSLPSGPCIVFAAAGTYNISVQFRAVSGTVTAKNRKLWVWTQAF